MINQINTLIEVNLLLLLTSNQNIMALHDFKDDQGNKLLGAKILADIMQQKGLIRIIHGEEISYELTEFGKQIATTGGWIEYINHQKQLMEKEITPTVPNITKTKKPGAELIVAGLIIIFLCLLIASCI